MAVTVRTGQMIIQEGLSAVALFWNQLTVLHRDQDRDFLDQSGLIEMRRKMAEQLDAMAVAVVEKRAFPAKDATVLVDPDLLASPRYGEYAQLSLARYQDLREQVCTLSGQA